MYTAAPRAPDTYCVGYTLPGATATSASTTACPAAVHAHSHTALTPASMPPVASATAPLGATAAAVVPASTAAHALLDRYTSRRVLVYSALCSYAASSPATIEYSGGTPSTTSVAA
ncbi:hypothetical protein NESM_000934500 [Novymonas esmeraldas]|uniref:Uncharacterized protein n=1 Tax=Novymonas esmeraldas TaxID=1808958 RepID=A0AAW0F2X1_9TRYP